MHSKCDEQDKKEMPKRRPPIKPFAYGKYLIEYREERDGLLRFYKEHVDSYKVAEKICEKLSREGYYEPEIKQIGWLDFYQKESLNLKSKELDD